MTLNTHVRFLEPIDPRDVLAFAAGLVNAPADFHVEHCGAGNGRGLAGWPLNPQLSATPGQGADALLYVEYGNEGSPLIDEWTVYAQEDPESYPASQRPPTGYVDVSFDSPYGYEDEFGRGCGDLHAEYAAAIFAWSEVPMAWEYEYDGTWHKGGRSLKKLGNIDRDRVKELVAKGRAALAKGHLEVDA